MKHLDEYVKIEKETPASAETVITKKDKEDIMSRLDEFMMNTQMEYNKVTQEDQRFIMENVELLFDNYREEDKQPFSW